MSDRALTPEMFTEMMLEFQEVMAPEDLKIPLEIELSKETGRFISALNQQMLDMFGISVLHAMGINVKEACKMLQANVIETKYADIQKELDRAYQGYQEEHEKTLVH